VVSQAEGVGCRIEHAELKNAFSGLNVLHPISAEVLIFDKLLFERSVAVGFVTTKDASLDVRQHTPKSAEVVFASRRQPSLLQKREGAVSLLGDDMKLHAVKEGIFRGAVSRPGGRRPPSLVKLVALSPT